MKKQILFLSIMDFTDKGIQVVKLTPEYFAKNGWLVHYVVARDNSMDGSYHYQDAIFPEGICVHRADMPSLSFCERLDSHLLSTIYSKLRGYAAIVKLVFMGRNVIQCNGIDVIYGGGPHGVLAASILNAIYASRNLFTVSRFYGVWDLYSGTISRHRWFKLLLNFDVLAALYLRSNLKIITDDGTLGDRALAWTRPSSLDTLRFYVNGTDRDPVDQASLLDLRKSLSGDDAFVAVCITRLVSTKRVDRCIRVAAAAVHQFSMCRFRLVIVGDGPERLRFEELALDLDLAENVVFVGAVDNSEVKNYLAMADVFLSMYDVSNVGNPLLEAIRATKVIFTLNNGDTSSWIEHGVNGFIYDVDESVEERIALDLAALAHDSVLRETIEENVRVTELERLWTWDERLHAEFSEVEKLVEGHS